MAILRLSPLLVNQIAAGEVIERPASVVKELMENAIDAGASRIEVVIERGGKELIRVADDGGGISSDDLLMAIAPHATSKISEADDLNSIATLGFRGEALASIASVSRLSIVSRPPEADHGAMIEAEGESVSEVRPASGSVGTTVTVRNLFFNTPARRKFLRTDQTEQGRVRQIIDGLALAHPGIAFGLKQDGRTMVDLPGEQTPTRRVIAVLGEELENELLEVSVEEGGVRMWGLVGRPGIARGTMKHLRVYLNGRPISDRTITHAIKEAYRGLIEPSRYPTAALFLSMNPAEVDVNVHPAKLEVRFRNQPQMHSVVLHGVRDRLREADLAPQFDLGRATSGGRVEFGNGLGSRLPEDTEQSSEGGTKAFVDYFKRLDPVQKGFIYGEVKQALREEAPEILAQEVEGGESSEVGMDSSAGDYAGGLPTVRTVQDILQVHSSFVVTQDEEGLVIIDQHALHERVMFEKLSRRIMEGNLESQRLLMPATLSVDRTQVDVLVELQPLLERLGIEAAPMGPDAVAVHAFTSLLFHRGVDPVEFMTDLLDKAANEGVKTTDEAALHEVLDMMACKAAIKAGDRLTPEELTELMHYRETVERSSNCPHGRPTSLRLSIADLEHQFGRR